MHRRRTDPSRVKKVKNPKTVRQAKELSLVSATVSVVTRLIRNELNCIKEKFNSLTDVRLDINKENTLKRSVPKQAYLANEVCTYDESRKVERKRSRAEEPEEGVRRRAKQEAHVECRFATCAKKSFFFF